MTTRNATSCEWTVTGMDCGSCAGKIRGALERLPGVADVDVALMTERLRLTLDEDQTSRDHVETAVKKLGFGIAPKGGAAPRKGFVLPDGAFSAGATGDAAPAPHTAQDTPAPAEGRAARDLSWYQTGKGRLVIGTGALLVAAWAVKLLASGGIANWAFILATLIAPERYLGTLLQLCQERRGIQRSIHYLDPTRVVISYELPLNEVILDFYDKLKSKTQGYASLDYELLGYRESELVRLDILLNGEPVDALSFITHKERAYQRGRQVAEKMKELIPKQMFEIAIQAAIGNKIIARETIGAIKKNVTAKCYGGDISRKRKLWDKQKEGKKRMKAVGRVEVPQEAFLAILKVGEE